MGYCYILLNDREMSFVNKYCNNTNPIILRDTKLGSLCGKG